MNGNTAWKIFPEVPEGSRVNQSQLRFRRIPKMGSGRGLECAANAKFAGLELEDQLIGVAIRAEKGGVESSLMLGVALGLRKTR